MEIIVPLAIGLAVACAVVVLCHMFIGSKSSRELPISAISKVSDEVNARRQALSFIDQRDFIEEDSKARKRKQSAARSQGLVLKTSPRPRKPKQPTMPDPGVVQ
jgi:hypothetical protein